MSDEEEEYIPRPPQEIILESGDPSDKQIAILGFMVFLAVVIGAALGFYEMFAALPLQ